MLPHAPLMSVRPSCPLLWRHRRAVTTPCDVDAAVTCLNMSLHALRPNHQELQLGGFSWSGIRLHIPVKAMRPLAWRLLRKAGVDGWYAEDGSFYVTSYPALWQGRRGWCPPLSDFFDSPQTILKVLFNPKETPFGLMWNDMLVHPEDAALFAKALGANVNPQMQPGPSAHLLFCPAPWARPSLFVAKSAVTPLTALALKLRQIWTAPMHCTLQSDALLICTKPRPVLGQTLLGYARQTFPEVENFNVQEGTLAGFVTYRFEQRKSRLIPQAARQMKFSFVR